MKRNHILLLNDNKIERMFRDLFLGSHRFFKEIVISPIDCAVSFSEEITEIAFMLRGIKQDLPIEVLLLDTDKHRMLEGLCKGRYTYINLPPINNVLDLYKMKELRLSGDNVEFWYHLISREINATLEITNV